jgi:hypothetical protein
MDLQKYENSTIEYKSLKKVIGKTADLKKKVSGDADT